MGKITDIITRKTYSPEDALRHSKDNKESFFSGGGGNGGDELKTRIAKLESDVGHIQSSLKDIKDDIREIKRDARTDFRLIFGAIIAVALGLAGLMAKGFHWY